VGAADPKAGIQVRGGQPALERPVGQGQCLHEPVSSEKPIHLQQGGVKSAGATTEHFISPDLFGPGDGIG
jgi:hypothetical protein